MAWAQETGIHPLGDLSLQSGQVLKNAKLGWTTHGTLRPEKNNVIVYSTSYSARAADLEWLIGPDGILDPTRWFIVIVNAFGNGVSSSPSNDPGYPDLVTAWDGVQAQRRLLMEQFGVDQVACVYGWSMGAQMAYHWAAAFPEAVRNIVVTCGSARTAIHSGHRRSTIETGGKERRPNQADLVWARILDDHGKDADSIAGPSASLKPAWLSFAEVKVQYIPRHAPAATRRTAAPTANGRSTSTTRL